MREKRRKNPVCRLPDWRMTLALGAVLPALWSQHTELEPVSASGDAEREMPAAWRQKYRAANGRGN